MDIRVGCSSNQLFKGVSSTEANFLKHKVVTGKASFFVIYFVVYFVLPIQLVLTLATDRAVLHGYVGFSILVLLSILKLSCRTFALILYKKNKKSSGTSLLGSFSACFLKKNIFLFIFYYLTKFHCLVFLTWWDILSSICIYCNCFLTRLWRHKFWINLIFLMKPCFVHYRKVKTKILIYWERKELLKVATVMQIEKSLVNDRLRVSKVSWKFRIPNIYNFAVIYQWNLLFS